MIHPRLKITHIAFLYALFAAIATVVNLLTQHILMELQTGPLAVFVAIGGGTLTGLVTKYVLDKKWIFFDRTAGLSNQSRQFSLYALMGVVTTLIFWGTELLFHFAFGTALMRNVGAVLGLAIGYIIKYELDRRFVFRPGTARETP